MHLIIKKVFFLLTLSVFTFINAVHAQEVEQPLNALQVASTSAVPVNINTADAGELAASLKGIGRAKAKAIVEFRELNGAFKSLEELTQVNGVGDAIVNKNSAIIVFE